MFIDTPRVAKRFSLTHDGTQIISVMRDRAQIGRVMRDLLFLQRLTRDIPLKFPWWLISFETRSRDVKNR